MANGKDYHRILGVAKSATIDEIKKAFRRLALLFHPDRNKDPKATEKFKEASEAYAVLTGKEKAPLIIPETRNRRQGTGNRSPVSWEYDVMRVWKDLEEERYNNSYR